MSEKEQGLMDTIPSVHPPNRIRLIMGYWTHAILPIGWWVFFLFLMPFVIAPIQEFVFFPAIGHWLLFHFLHYLTFADSVIIQNPVVFSVAILSLILTDGMVYVSFQSGGNFEYARQWRVGTLLIQAVLTLCVGLLLFGSMVWVLPR